ncbi:MAG: MipA/OmpV family protein [Pseudomonadota bacterium]
MLINRFLCSLATSILALATAAAQTSTEDQPQARSFIVTGAAALPEFEGAERLRPVPLIVSRFSALGTEVEIEGLEGRVDLLPHPVWRAGPAFGVILPRNDDFIDTAAVTALESIDTAVELGGFVGFRVPFGNLKEGTLTGTTTVRHDVLGSHSALTVDSELEYFFAVNRMLRVGVAANASFATSDYFDTYFSVDADGAAASGLTEFDAGGGARDVGFEAFSILSFSERWGIFSRVAYNRLLGDAADSSIVEEVGSENQVFFGGGLFVNF